jgi:lambda family phage tail tape measure protein
MATTSDSYELTVITGPAQANIERLNNSIKNTSTQFDGLRQAIASLAIAGFIKQTFDLANSINDSAKAAGLSTAVMLAFSRAVASSGGTMQQAAGGADNFSQAIDSAVQGSMAAQDNFLRLQITLEDLNTLSESQLFSKMITGLENIQDKSLRAALAINIMGRAGKGVDFGEVAEKMRRLRIETEGQAEAFTSAATARESINSALVKLQAQILVALEPIAKLADAILSMGTAVSGFIRIAVNIGVVVLAFTALGKIIQLAAGFIVLLGEALASIGTMFTVGANGARGFGLILKDLGTLPFAGQLRVILTLGGEFIAWIAKLIPGLATVSVLLYEGGVGLYNWVRGMFAATDATKDSNKATDDAAKKSRELIDALKKQRIELAYQSIEFGRANEKIIQRLGLDGLLIGRSKEQVDVANTINELNARTTEEINKLIKAKQELNAAELRAGMGVEYDKQIKKLHDINIADSARMADQVRNNARLQSIEQLRLYGLQNEITRTTELKTIQDDMAKLTMTEIEKKYYDIESAAKDAARAAIAAEEARTNQRLDPAEAQKYYDASLKGVEALRASTGTLYENSRLFSTGWNQALNDFVTNAGNAASIAQNLFQRATQGMEDAIVNFSKTGKFEFKNFVAMMTEELLRSQVRQLMANIMLVSRGATGGGLLSGIKSLFGFAAGGVVGANQPVIVGERGPEVFMPAGGGNIIPNGAMSGGAGAVTLNINAVDAPSFQALVARNPQFIHAVAEMGRRSIPGAR